MCAVARLQRVCAVTVCCPSCTSWLQRCSYAELPLRVRVLVLKALFESRLVDEDPLGYGRTPLVVHWCLVLLLGAAGIGCVVTH